MKKIISLTLAVVLACQTQMLAVTKDEIKTIASELHEIFNSASHNNTNKLSAALKGKIDIIKEHLEDASIREALGVENEQFQSLQNCFTSKKEPLRSITEDNGNDLKKLVQALSPILLSIIKNDNNLSILESKKMRILAISIVFVVLIAYLYITIGIQGADFNDTIKNLSGINSSAVKHCITQCINYKNISTNEN